MKVTLDLPEYDLAKLREMKKRYYESNDETSENDIINWLECMLIDYLDDIHYEVMEEEE